uniref:Uncharacterized protein n=1 Tax=Anopheles atroparvus TaxID=41427 RepID=A0A182JGY1_ANOAO
EEHKALVEKYERIKEHNANSKALLEQYQDVVSELETLKCQHQVSARDLKSTVEENRELKQTSAKLSAALQESEAELAQYLEKFNATNTENLALKEQRREIEALKCQHQAVMSDLKSIIEENRELKQTSAKLSAALQESEAELAQYREKFNATNTEHLELKEQRREIEALKCQQQAVMSDLKSTIEENRELKQTIRFDEGVNVFGASGDQGGEKLREVLRRLLNLLLRRLGSGTLKTGKLARDRALLEDSDAVAKVFRLLLLVETKLKMKKKNNTIWHPSYCTAAKTFVLT